MAACLLSPSFARIEAGPKPYDCRVGLDDWRTGWTLEKKSWCCQNHNLGCRASEEDEEPLEFALADNATDAEAGSSTPQADAEAGSSTPQAERYGPGHCVSTWKTEASHCMVRTDCAQQDISRYPIAFLCEDSAGGRVRHVFGKDSFAPEETFDTLIICEECKADIGPQGRVRDTKALNTTLQAFVKEVAEIKQKALTARIEVHSLSSIVRRVYRIEADMYQVSDLFHCDVGRANWKAGWSKEKKCWCCSTRNVGCEPENFGCVPETPVMFKPAPFNCSVGLDNHELGWSNVKKCWCCKTSNVGCGAQMACEPEVHAVVAPSPSPKFHCNAGLQNHELGWSDEKKIWCCQAYGLGCMTENVTRWPKDPHDCWEDLGAREANWAPAKKFWCCQKHGIGCTPDDVKYDCFTGLHDTKRLWSVQKRRRCCRTHGVGCSWAELKSVVRGPKNRHTMTTTALRQSPRVLPGHRQIMVSHDARASWPSTSPAALIRRRVRGARTPTTTTAATVSKRSALTEEAWELDVESEARMRQLGLLRRQYQRATSPELVAMASLKAKAAAAAQEATEADKVGSLSTWSGPLETEDETAAREAQKRVEARAASGTGLVAASFQWRQWLDRRGSDQRADRRSRLRRASAAAEQKPEATASQAEQLDDANSAASLVESLSFVAGAEIATSAPPSGERRAEAAGGTPDAQGGAGPVQATVLWWENDEDTHPAVGLSPAADE